MPSGGGGRGGGGAGGAAANIAMAAVGLAAVAGFAIGSYVVQQALPPRGRSARSGRSRPPPSSQPSHRRLQRSNVSVEACRQHRVRARTARASSRMHSAPVHLLEAAMPIDAFERLPNKAVLSIMQSLDLTSLCCLARVSSSWRRLLTMISKDKHYIQSCAWRGFGDSRFNCWMRLLRSELTLTANVHLYRELSSVEDDAIPCSDSIFRDLHRTLPQSDVLSGTAGQQKLFRVLKAYAVSDPEVGYCQGMNFLAGFLLTLTSEENAFYLLDRLMRDFEARWMYTPGLPQLSLSLWQLDRLTEMMLPKLHAHLHLLKVQPQLYASEWFVGFFAYTLSLEDTARIWDIFFTQGWKALHRVALAYLSLLQDDVLKLGFEQTVRHLKTAPRSGSGCIDIEQVFRVASSFKVTNSFLDVLEEQYFAEEGRC